MIIGKVRNSCLKETNQVVIDFWANLVWSLYAFDSGIGENG